MDGRLLSLLDGMCQVLSYFSEAYVVDINSSQYATTHMLTTSSTCFWFTNYHSCSNEICKIAGWTSKWCWSMSTPQKHLSFCQWTPFKWSGDTRHFLQDPWKPNPHPAWKNVGMLGRNLDRETKIHWTKHTIKVHDTLWWDTSMIYLYIYIL